MKILVVDDAAFMRMQIKTYINHVGTPIEVIEAADGNDAVAKYKDVHPDLVTMDITMPEVDGIEAVRQIREYDPEARILMVSAIDQTEIVVQAIEAGAFDFIVKPCSEDDVVSKLRKALSIEE